jgi:hypothetical protein
MDLVEYDRACKSGTLILDLRNSGITILIIEHVLSLFGVYSGDGDGSALNSPKDQKSLHQMKL